MPRKPSLADHERRIALLEEALTLLLEDREQDDTPTEDLEGNPLPQPTPAGRNDTF